MHLERVTVTDLLHELEAGEPDVKVASLSSPPGRSRTPSTPARPSVVDIGQGAQLGHLPEPARNQLGS